MSRFLFVWELGAGLGHVAVQRPLAHALHERGHDVVLAVRNVRSARTAFAGTGLRCLQCPYQTWKPPLRFMPMRTYAHILHDSAFNSVEGLASLLESWIELFSLVKPDVIVFDHSPTALLAARSCGAKRVLHGIGFAAPPPTTPLPALQPGMADPGRHEADEQLVLDIATRAVEQTRLPPIHALADLYGEVDLNLLSTYPELDHFGPRPGTRYWGVREPMPAADPEWPAGSGKRIFAYLKPARGLDRLLRLLNESGHPTLVVGTWVTDESRRGAESRTVRLLSSPLSIRSVAKECDLAILNGTHSTTAEMLLCGVPVLQFPIFVEQGIVATRTAGLGAGIIADLRNPGETAAALRRMTTDDQFRSAAAKFADRYRDNPEIGTLEEMVQTVTGLTD